MNPGRGLNNVPDSFAPAPEVDLMWHIKNPRAAAPSRPPELDTEEAILADARFAERETNQALSILLKTSKILILTLIAPPFFLFVKFPRGLKRIAFPPLKIALVTLTKTLKENYDKAKSVMENALTRISTHVVRFMEGVSNLSQKLKATVSQFANEQMEAVKSRVAPVADTAKWMAEMLAAASAKASELMHAAMQKQKFFKDGLKGLSLPKVFSPNYKETFRNVLVAANEALYGAWNRMKERADSAKRSLDKAIEETKNRLSGLKDLSSRQLKKAQKPLEAAGEQIAKAVNIIQTTLVHQGERLVLFVQQPYFALAPYASAMRGHVSRSFQAVSQAFLNTVNAFKVSFIQSAQAFLMPFRRGAAFLHRQALKLASKLQQGAKWLLKQALEQGNKWKKKAQDLIQKWMQTARRAYGILKVLMKRLLHGLKLFWIWLKLTTSFAGFLIRQLFGEVRVWLKRNLQNSN